MKITYNDILNNMKNTYFQISGEAVEKQTDLELRFKAVASELYSLMCTSEFMLKQAFPQTASGEYLDRHAQMRDIVRKSASKAYGSVTFSVTSPAENDILIPQGTVCASATNPYLQYTTDADAVISTGETQTVAGVTAADFGSAYNVPAGNVTVLVNPPLGVEAIINEEAIGFGCDEESDRALKNRILTSYSIPQSGMSSKSLRECIMRLDEVLDCSVSYGNGKLIVTVKTADGTLNNDLKNKIEACYYFREMLPFAIRIYSAQPLDYSLEINVRVNDGKYDDIEDEIRRCVKEYTDTLGIGDSVSLKEILYNVSRVASVEFAEILCDEAESGIVAVPPEKYPFLSEIRVNCHE